MAGGLARTQQRRRVKGERCCRDGEGGERERRLPQGTVDCRDKGIVQVCLWGEAQERVWASRRTRHREVSRIKFSAESRIFPNNFFPWSREVSQNTVFCGIEKFPDYLFRGVEKFSDYRYLRNREVSRIQYSKGTAQESDPSVQKTKAIDAEVKEQQRNYNI